MKIFGKKVSEYFSDSAWFFAIIIFLSLAQLVLLLLDIITRNTFDPIGMLKIAAAVGAGAYLSAKKSYSVLSSGIAGKLLSLSFFWIYPFWLPSQSLPYLLLNSLVLLAVNAIIYIVAAMAGALIGGFFRPKKSENKKKRR